MKKSIVAILVLSCVLSCRYKDVEPLDCKVFDSVIFERHVTFEDMLNDVMEQYGKHAGAFDELDELLEIGRKVAKAYKVYGIRYKTTDHEGKPVLASGLVYFPEGMKIRGTIEIVPVNKYRGSCGTVNRSIPEAMAGCTGYIMIASDLLGCGESSEYPISYLQHELVAKNAADMRKAAYEFINNYRNMRLDKKDFLLGYSLGGSGVLALARFYAKHPEYGIKVKELWLGAGAYDPKVAVETIVASGREGTMLVPNILWSMDKYDSLNVNFDNVFIGELKNTYPELVNGDVSTDSLRNRFGMDSKEYLNMDFFTDTSTVWQQMRATFAKKAVPIDFKPDYPIVLYHSEDDETIPVALSDTLYKRLTAVGAKVDYRRGTGSHHLIGFKIEGDMAKSLYYR